jgi:hypothetical protein
MSGSPVPRKVKLNHKGNTAVHALPLPLTAARAFSGMIQTETATAEWHFLQENATLHDSGDSTGTGEPL